MRSTSINTYNEIKASGLLSKRRMEVYEALFHNGPMTPNELVRHYKDHFPESNPTGWNARFSELERMGVIKEVGKRDDEISGNECTLWDVTDKLPEKLQPKFVPVSSKKTLVKKIEELGVSIDPKWKAPLREIWSLANGI